MEPDVGTGLGELNTESKIFPLIISKKILPGSLIIFK